jgi:hypothetical protein
MTVIWIHDFESYENIANEHSHELQLPKQVNFYLPMDITIKGVSNGLTTEQTIKNVLSISPFYRTKCGVQTTGLTLTTTSDNISINPMTTFNITKKPSEIKWRTIMHTPSDITYTGIVNSQENKPITDSEHIQANTSGMYRSVNAYTTNVINNVVDITFEIYNGIDSVQSVNNILANSLVITTTPTGQPIIPTQLL